MYYVDCERFPQRIMTLSAFVRVGAKLYSSCLFTLFIGDTFAMKQAGWRLWVKRSPSFSIDNAAAKENSDLLHFALLTLLWWHSTAAITHFMSSRSVAYFINERGLLNLRLIILVTPCSLALTPKYDC